MLRKIGKLDDLTARAQLIDPVGYLDTVRLEKYAAFFTADSGGVQKEALFCRVPCVTQREEAEWVELVDSGWNRLTPPLTSTAFADAVIAALGRNGQPIAPCGQGNTAQRFFETLRDF